MDLIFLIILFFILVILLFIFNRIVWKSTVWSSFVSALWWSLIIILLLQAVGPCSFSDNRSSVMGVMLIVLFVLVVGTVYITDMSIRDVDPVALYTVDRNIVFW